MNIKPRNLKLPSMHENIRSGSKGMCSTCYIDINYPLQSFRWYSMVIIVIADTDTCIEKAIKYWSRT